MSGASLFTRGQRLHIRQCMVDRWEPATVERADADGTLWVVRDNGKLARITKRAVREHVRAVHLVGAE